MKAEVKAGILEPVLQCFQAKLTDESEVTHIPKCLREQIRQTVKKLAIPNVPLTKEALNPEIDASIVQPFLEYFRDHLTNVNKSKISRLIKFIKKKTRRTVRQVALSLSQDDNEDQDALNNQVEKDAKDQDFLNDHIEKDQPETVEKSQNDHSIIEYVVIDDEDEESVETNKSRKRRRTAPSISTISSSNTQIILVSDSENESNTDAAPTQTENRKRKRVNDAEDVETSEVQTVDEVHKIQEQERQARPLFAIITTLCNFWPQFSADEKMGLERHVGKTMQCMKKRRCEAPRPPAPTPQPEPEPKADPLLNWTDDWYDEDDSRYFGNLVEASKDPLWDGPTMEEYMAQSKYVNYCVYCKIYFKTVEALAAHELICFKLQD